MIELLGLVLAIAMVVAVTSLRTLMAMPFARSRARFVDAAPPPAHAEAFEHAFATLHEAGFDAPRWLLSARVDGEPVPIPIRAGVPHPDGSIAWLAPPTHVAAPRRLTCWIGTALADGRIAISQAFDPYCESVQDGGTLVARTVAAPTLHDHWQSHRAWVDTLGPRAGAASATDAGMLDQAEGLPERLHAALLARGRLRRINADLAVPRLGFALHLLRRWMRAPKPPPDLQPASPAQLAPFVRIAELAAHRAPPRDMQWLLFGASVVLFMALGGLVWGLALAAAILLVVLVHEAGHFLAMRAFGYRNLQVLALPLVGGVALGVDARPDAARQAWMSLAGPLPGIAIGWVLLLLLAFGGAPVSANAWLWPLALVFLFVNYLNVLPIPPLDGAHVVRALLPPRHGRIETVFIGVAALLGAVFAWQHDMPLIAALAALQLLFLRGGWRLHGSAARLAAIPGFADRHRGLRVVQVLQALHDDLGPPAAARARVAEAMAVLQRLETQPMGALVRVATGAVYLALLVVPVLWFTLGASAWTAAPASAAVTAMRADADADLARARALPLQALLQDATGAALPQPATAATLDAAAARLGAPLPDDLVAAYRIADGAPPLRPLAQWQPAAALVDRDVLPYAPILYLWHDGASVELPTERIRSAWHAGGDPEAPLLYLPREDPLLPGIRWLELDLESPTPHARLDDWLAARRAAEFATVRFVAARRQQVALAREQLRGVDVAGLLAAATPEPPGLLLRLLGAPPVGLPPAASPATLAAAASRLGVALDPMHAAALAIHDGFAPLQLLPIADWRPWAVVRERLGPDALAAPGWAPADDAATDTEAIGEAWMLDDPRGLDGCTVVGGYAPPPDAPGEAVAMLVWCPPGHAHAGWVDLIVRRRFEAFDAWLREQVAQRLPASG